MSFKITSILLILCLLPFNNISAQNLPYLKGRVKMNNGTVLSGYVTVLNSKKIAFKVRPTHDRIRLCRSNDVQMFSYGKEKYVAIKEGRSTFFVRQMSKGKTAVYKRDFAPNRNKTYYLKTKDSFTSIDKRDFYDDMKENLESIDVFKTFDREMFQVAFDYNQEEIKTLVADYNAQEYSKTRMMDFEVNPSDTVGTGEILGFAMNAQAYGLGGKSNSNKIPNTVRNDLLLKPEVIYNQMLISIEDGNWKKVATAIKLLKPLAAEIEANSESISFEALKVYIKGKHKKKAKSALVIFVSEGVQYLMKNANYQQKASTRKLMIRQGFVEFLEIKETLKMMNPKAARTITSQFKVAFASASNKTNFTKSTVNISSSFNKLTAKL